MKQQVLLSETGTLLAQSGTPIWLLRLLVNGLLFLTVLNASAQTTWTSRPQSTNQLLIDVAYGAGSYVVVGGDGAGEYIQASTDGITWTTQTTDHPSSGGLFGVIYASGKFVAVGAEGRVLTSTDGLTWTAQASGTTKNLNDIAYGGGLFMAVGDDGTAITSADGQTWTTQTSGTSKDWFGLAYGSNKFVAVGENGLISTTLNGIIWTVWTSNTMSSLKGVTAGGNGSFVAVGQNSAIVNSPDGQTWTLHAGPGSIIELTGVAYNATSGKFVAVARAKNQVFTSPDGLNWGAYQLKSGTDFFLYSVRFLNGQYLAVGEGNTIRSSTLDGIGWRPLTIDREIKFNGTAYGNGHYVAVGIYPYTIFPSTGTVAVTSTDGINYVRGTTDHLAGAAEGFYDVTFGNGKFVAVGGEAIIQTSTDGKVWTIRHSAMSANLNGIAYGNGQYVAVGAGLGPASSGNFVRSTDGITWTVSSSGENTYYYGIIYVNSQFVAVGFNGSIGTSPDGVNWTARASGTNKLLRRITYGNGVYVAVGADGTIVKSTNSINWTSVPAFTGYDLNNVTFGNGQFVVVTEAGDISVSTTGDVWDDRSSDSDGFPLNGITYANGLFVVVGDGATVITSPDGDAPVDPGSFAFTGVTQVICQTVSATKRVLTFNPQYTGLNGQSISFSVYNELSPTTASGPYSLNMYIDNPTITLKATQTGTAGEASFTYNWLSDCGVTPPNNQAPTVANTIPPQTTTQNQPFSYVIPGNTFADPNGDALTLAVMGLPAGVNFTAPATISGSPTDWGAFTITVTATDGGNLSVSTQFTLAVNPAPVNGSFTISGVTLVDCQTVSATQRLLSFSPQYTGLSGQPISFSVVNELSPTTASGPYSLNMYIDNPTITLKATQTGTDGEASLTYNWLDVCNNSKARIGVSKLAETALSVQVLGNPVENGVLQVEVRGAGSQPLHLSLTDLRGQIVGTNQVQQADSVEHHQFEMHNQPAGLYLLRVSTPTQVQTVKVLKR